MLGGSSDSYRVEGKLKFNIRGEILTFDGEDWKEVGKLQKNRSDHAVTKIDATGLMDLCD